LTILNKQSVVLHNYFIAHICEWYTRYNIRVRTDPWKPGMSWNLKIWIPGLESPGIVLEVLESPGIWTYRSIFLIISIQEFSRYTSSKIWVYLYALKVHEFIEKILEFDFGTSWKVLKSEMSKCVWTLNIHDGVHVIQLMLYLL